MREVGAQEGFGIGEAPAFFLVARVEFFDHDIQGVDAVGEFFKLGFGKVIHGCFED